MGNSKVSQCCKRAAPLSAQAQGSTRQQLIARERPYLIARIGLNRGVLLEAAASAVGCVKSGSGGRIWDLFLRRFTLPESAQADAIKARYTNGVLKIEIPKQARVEAKRIAVTVN